MDVHIRIANTEDIPAVCRLVGQLSPNPLGEGAEHNYTDAVAKFQSHIDPSPDYFLWVAETDAGEIVGTAMMHLQHKLSYECGTAGHLEDVVVDQQARGQGVGSMLVRQAIQTAKDHNCYKLMLTCWRSTGNVEYYQRFGFKEHDVGMRMEF